MTEKLIVILDTLTDSIDSYGELQDATRLNDDLKRKICEEIYEKNINKVVYQIYLLIKEINELKDLNKG